MKKDINLLSAEKQVSGNKQVNGIIVGIIAVILVVGLLMFLFINTKGKISKIDTDIAKLEQDKSFYGPKNEIQNNELTSATNMLNNYLADLLTEDLLNNRIDSVFILSTQTIDTLIQQNEVEGITKIRIKSIGMDEMNPNKLTLICYTEKDLGRIECYDEMIAYQNRILENVSMIDQNDELILAVKATDIVDKVYNDSQKYLEFTISVTFKRVDSEVIK